jgi:nucleoside-diphosphate-sugar epimerase
MLKKVLVIGGAGYVGQVLCPALKLAGFDVTVFDTMWYTWNLNLTGFSLIAADMRDKGAVMQACKGQDAVIHLACVSNDPSFELNPNLGKSINYDSFAGILEAIKENKVQRFIYASSSSVYGLKEKTDVVETDSCEPLTDYSKYKLACENDLRSSILPDCTWTIVRPATVCGPSPRQRFDVVVNAMTINALERATITVNGGGQLRPNLHIYDMVRAYIKLLESPSEKINGETFNIGTQNISLMAIARLVQETIPGFVSIQTNPTNDPRSYHVNSTKIEKAIGFRPEFSVKQAIEDICESKRLGRYHAPLTNPQYYNILRMKELEP